MTYKIEKPFTDTKENYTVLNSESKDCFDVVNLKSGGKYVTNPFKKICNCPDFQFRGDGGTCKHIEYLRENKNIKPLVKKYEKEHEKEEEPKKITPTVEVMEQSEFQIMERRDENQILGEMKGNVLEVFVYSFPQGGKQITGLSYAGVKQIALEMGNIHCGEPILQENGDSWICKVKARDIQRNLEMWGVSQQSKTMDTKWGQKPDSFCIQKAVSKSERNALRKLMPEKIIIETIKEWQSNKNNGRGDGR